MRQGLMSTLKAVSEWRQRALEAESELLRVQERIQAAEAKAERLQKSLKDSWQFTKTILRTRV
jgi:predicted  nucleic acid-binding Zn-ribbon protein